MNLNIFQFLNSQRVAGADVTCPNCGDVTRDFDKQKKFHCSHCGYSIPMHSGRDPGHGERGSSKLVEYLCLFLGIASAGFGLKGFLIPNGLIDGGVTGISLLASKVSGFQLAYFLIAINAPFILISYYQLGKTFAFRAFFAIAGLATVLPFMEMDIVTHDRLLCAVFGGVFLGAGIGLSIKGGGVLDGTEILALFISRRFPATVGDVILFFNILIFSTALLFLQPEAVLYSVLTYLSASKTVDFLLHGIESLSGVFIISPHSPTIRYKIVNEMGRGVTLLKGKGGFSEKDQDVIFCVVTRLEISKIKNLALSTDPNSFLVVFPISDVSGGIIRKILESRAEKHSKTM